MIRSYISALDFVITFRSYKIKPILVVDSNRFGL